MTDDLDAAAKKIVRDCLDAQWQADPHSRAIPTGALETAIAAALRAERAKASQEIERLRHQLRDTANARNQAEQERERLRDALEECIQGCRGYETQMKGLRGEAIWYGFRKVLTQALSQKPVKS